MYLAYDHTGTRELRLGWGLNYWLWPEFHTDLACNVSVWIVPGTVED